MKLTCDKQTLVTAISTVLRTVSSKSTLSFLEGIYIKAETELSMTGYNLETGITVRIEANIKQEGECVIPAKIFSDIIRKLPDETVSITVDANYKVSIKGGKSSFKILAMTADEYPQLPAVEEQSTVELPQAVLRKLISGTIFDIGENTGNQIITGCLLVTDGNEISMVSMDGYRMAVRSWKKEGEPFPAVEFVVPGAALKELEKICQDSDKPIRFANGRTTISFEVENTILICRLLEGKFPDWRRFIPKGNPIRLTANVAELTAAVERVNLIVSERYKAPLRCTFTRDAVQLRTVTTVAEATDACRVAGEGDEIEIGFNCRYILDALKAIQTPEVRLELSGAKRPMILVPVDDAKSSYTYLVQPVLLSVNI